MNRQRRRLAREIGPDPSSPTVPNRDSRPRGPTDVFLRLEGEHTRSVALIGNDFLAVRRGVFATSGVASDAWTEVGNAVPTTAKRTTAND